MTLLAFALRLYQLGARSLWYDELLELDIAQGPFTEILPNLTQHAAMPLDYFLLHGWITFGRQDIWVRFPAFFFGVLAIPLIYVLGNRFFNRRVGYLAALLLTFSTFAVRYSQEVRPYAGLLVWVIVAYLGLWRVYQTHQNRYWGMFGLGLMGAVSSHYFALFILLPLSLFVGIRQIRYVTQTKYWQHTAFFGLSLVLLVFGLVVLGRLPVLYSVGQRFLVESYQLEKYAQPPAEKLNGGAGPPVDVAFFVEKVLMPLGTVDPTTLLIYSMFFLVALLSLLQYRHKNRAAVLLLLAWLILPIISIYAFLLYRGTFYAIRYILYTLPAYLVLVAYGIETLTRLGLKLYSTWRERRLSAGVSNKVDLLRIPLAGMLLLLCLTPLLSAQLDQLHTLYTSLPYENWRAVAQILQNNAAPDDAVIAVRAEPALNWYYPPARAAYGTYSRSQPLWEAMRQHKRRWFVLSSYSFKRDEGLRQWLKRQGAVTIAIDRRVVIHFHEEGKSTAALLDQVATFSLPQNVMTYRVLADQFKAVGDIKTSEIFYRKAAELGQASTQPAHDDAGLIALMTTLFGN